MAGSSDDLFSVAGKRVLVTGGSRGIGAMIAAGLVRAGAKVIVSARKPEALERTAAELSRHGACAAVAADLSRPEGAEALAAAVAERFGALDVLVNNAGAAWGAPLEEFPVDGWDKVFDTNVRGVFLLTRATRGLLAAAASDADPARVINIGSILGSQVPAGWENYPYTASKAAVAMLTRHLAARLAPERITVNALAPGWFESRMTAQVIEPGGTGEVAAGVPLGRTGRPDDVDGAVRWLASRAGAYVTGAVVTVDGGAALGTGPWPEETP